MLSVLPYYTHRVTLPCRPYPQHPTDLPCCWLSRSRMLLPSPYVAPHVSSRWLTLFVHPKWFSLVRCKWNRLCYMVPPLPLSECLYLLHVPQTWLASLCHLTADQTNGTARHCPISSNTSCHQTHACHVLLAASTLPMTVWVLPTGWTLHRDSQSLHRTNRH